MRNVHDVNDHSCVSTWKRVHNVRHVTYCSSLVSLSNRATQELLVVTNSDLLVILHLQHST